MELTSLADTCRGTLERPIRIRAAGLTLANGLTKAAMLLVSVALAAAAGVVLVQRAGPAEPVAADEWWRHHLSSPGSGVESSPLISPTYETDIYTDEGFRERDRAARAQGKTFTVV